MKWKRDVLEKHVKLLLSIVQTSGEVAQDIGVSTVTTNHPDNPTWIKLDLMDGSELLLTYKPRNRIASSLH